MSPSDPLTAVSVVRTAVAHLESVVQAGAQHWTAVPDEFLLFRAQSSQVKDCWVSKSIKFTKNVYMLRMWKLVIGFGVQESGLRILGLGQNKIIALLWLC
jgi:hypothetical protein